MFTKVISSENRMDERQIITMLQNHCKKISDYVPEINENLFETGVIDSFGALEFINFLQESFKIEISQEDITIDNLINIKSILKLIKRKLA